VRKPAKSRIKRYADRIKGTDAIDRTVKLTLAAVRASAGYADYDTDYGSGYQAGETESGILKEKYRQTDRDIRNFGDFLISYGDYIRNL
jgi:hypothetical protein